MLHNCYNQSSPCVGTYPGDSSCHHKCKDDIDRPGFLECGKGTGWRNNRLDCPVDIYDDFCCLYNSSSCNLRLFAQANSLKTQKVLTIRVSYLLEEKYRGFLNNVFFLSWDKLWYRITFNGNALKNVHNIICVARWTKKDITISFGLVLKLAFFLVSLTLSLNLLMCRKRTGYVHWRETSSVPSLHFATV